MRIHILYSGISCAQATPLTQLLPQAPKATSSPSACGYLQGRGRRARASPLHPATRAAKMAPAAAVAVRTAHGCGSVIGRGGTQGPNTPEPASNRNAQPRFAAAAAQAARAALPIAPTCRCSCCAPTGKPPYRWTHPDPDLPAGRQGQQQRASSGPQAGAGRRPQAACSSCRPSDDHECAGV